MKSALSAFSLFFLALGLVPQPAAAATANTSFGVSATVQASCLVSVSEITSGTYARAAVNAIPSVSVSCTNAAPYNVGLSTGLAPGATVVARRMSGPGAALLGYALASRSTGIANQGQAVDSDTVAMTGNRSAQMLSIHGQNSAGQYEAAGVYADTVVVTVTY